RARGKPAHRGWPGESRASSPRDLGHRGAVPWPLESPARPRHADHVGSTRGEAARPPIPIPAGRADYLIGTAARAPSVHNTQPWRLQGGGYAIELCARLSPQLAGDPLGPEMLITFRAPLFALRPPGR